MSTNIQGLPVGATVAITLTGTAGESATATVGGGVQPFANLPRDTYRVSAKDFIDSSTTPATIYQAQIAGQYVIDADNTVVLIRYNKFVPPVPGSVPLGWAAGKVTMASLYDNSEDARKAMVTRPVAAAFTYAGESGGGDPGVVVPLEKSKIPQTMGQLSDPRSNKYQTMPIFVVYTANGSGGGTAGALQDIENADYLQKHYQTLIIYAKALESYYLNVTNPLRATIVLNPDFLGNVLKDGQVTPTTPLPIIYPGESQSLSVRQVLLNALTAQGEDTTLLAPTQFTGNNLIDYVQSVNWVLGVFAPDIPYGWEEADWAGDVEGNLWLHRPNPQTTVPAHVAIETNFLNALQVFAPVPVITTGGVSTTTQPSFIGFDKYGANPVFQGNSQYVDQGYLFNTQDWDNYMAFTSQVAKNLNLPLMLFQIPGAHLPETGEANPYFDVATGPNYFLGASSAGLNFAAFSRIPGQIKTLTYYTANDMNPGSYLLLNGQQVWLQNHINELEQNKVFAILWGAGAFATGILPEAGPTFDDNGWLYNLISKSSSYVLQPQLGALPEPTTLPVYPEGRGGYVSGSRVTTAAKVCAYQCFEANWCNLPGYAPETTPYWSMAWYPLTPACRSVTE